MLGFSPLASAPLASPSVGESVVVDATGASGNAGGGADGAAGAGGDVGDASSNSKTTQRAKSRTNGRWN